MWDSQTSTTSEELLGTVKEFPQLTQQGHLQFDEDFHNFEHQSSPIMTISSKNILTLQTVGKAHPQKQAWTFAMLSCAQRCTHISLPSSTCSGPENHRLRQVLLRGQCSRPHHPSPLVRVNPRLPCSTCHLRDHLSFDIRKQAALAKKQTLLIGCSRWPAPPFSDSCAQAVISQQVRGCLTLFSTVR